MQEHYWRADSHKEEVYKCRHNFCTGEGRAAKALAGVGPDEDLPASLTPPEREKAHLWHEEPVGVCRKGHTGRLCEVRQNVYQVLVGCGAGTC
jgi:hypothetical protein